MFTVLFPTILLVALSIWILTENLGADKFSLLLLYTTRVNPALILPYSFSHDFSDIFSHRHYLPEQSTQLGGNDRVINGEKMFALESHQ